MIGTLCKMTKLMTLLLQIGQGLLRLGDLQDMEATQAVVNRFINEFTTMITAPRPSSEDTPMPFCLFQEL